MDDTYAQMNDRTSGALARAIAPIVAIKEITDRINSICLGAKIPNVLRRYGN
jgi:hypothetical protein